jgi:hypothetical protein
MIITNDGYFYVVLTDQNNKDVVLGTYLTRDEALKDLLSFMKQMTDYLHEAIQTLDEGSN